jgi:hypothetical protein
MLESDKRFQSEYSKCLEEGTSGDLNDGETIMKTLGWNITSYQRQWGLVIDLMSIKDFDKPHRISKEASERILVMSGLGWNHLSQSRDRDWINVAASVTVEMMFVNSYRLKLLMSCRGACVLRDEILAYFGSIATLVVVGHPTTGEVMETVPWRFPDGIPTPLPIPGSDAVQRYNPEAMRRDLEGLSLSQSKENDPVSKLLYNLAKNKLLWSSGDGVSPGTLETLAYHSIANLWQASRPFVPRSSHDPHLDAHR